MNHLYRLNARSFSRSNVSDRLVMKLMHIWYPFVREMDCEMSWNDVSLESIEKSIVSNAPMDHKMCWLCARVMGLLNHNGMCRELTKAIERRDQSIDDVVRRFDDMLPHYPSTSIPRDPRLLKHMVRNENAVTLNQEIAATTDDNGNKKMRKLKAPKRKQDPSMPTLSSDVEVDRLNTDTERKLYMDRLKRDGESAIMELKRNAAEAELSNDNNTLKKKYKETAPLSKSTLIATHTSSIGEPSVTDNNIERKYDANGNVDESDSSGDYSDNDDESDKTDRDNNENDDSFHSLERAVNRIHQRIKNGDTFVVPENTSTSENSDRTA